MDCSNCKTKMRKLPGGHFYCGECKEIFVVKDNKAKVLEDKKGFIEKLANTLNSSKVFVKELANQFGFALEDEDDDDENGLGFISDE